MSLPLIPSFSVNHDHMMCGGHRARALAFPSPGQELPGRGASSVPGREGPHPTLGAPLPPPEVGMSYVVAVCGCRPGACTQRALTGGSVGALLDSEACTA